MATTVTASTLKVTVKEDITLNGKKHEFKQEQSIDNVNMIAQRIVRVPTSTEKILDFNSTTIGAGQYVAGDVKYIRITNLDDTIRGYFDTAGDTKSDFLDDDISRTPSGTGGDVPLPDDRPDPVGY